VTDGNTRVKVIAISREYGAGGEQVGALVAERLGFRYVDDEIVAQAAAKGNFTHAEVADAEKRRSFALRLIEQIGRASTPAYAAPIVANQAATEQYQDLIREVVVETASQGSAVIVAHAASIALADRDDVLRVLVVAPPKVRAERIATEGGVKPDEAAKIVKSSDADRRSYFKRFYDVTEQPTQYDLVLNTGGLSFEQAAGVLAEAARA
jgi:cytidylate kinase